MPDVQVFLDQLMGLLGNVSPVWAAIVAIVVVLARGGSLKLPTLGLSKDALKEKVKQKAGDTYQSLVDGGADEDAVYSALTKAVKEVKP